MAEILIPYNQLSPEQKAAYPNPNWRLNGISGDWDEIVDNRYGVVEHLATVDSETLKIMFDKINLKWAKAVFVVPVRINPDNQAEFLLARERRVLLRDSQGNQGNLTIDNIPQGLVKVWSGESERQAAIRETKEETGHEPTGLVLVGNVGFDIANSESLMPFYLAQVPYYQNAIGQQLDKREVIGSVRWATFSEIQQQDLIDGKTMIGLYLAKRVIHPNYH